MIEVENYKIIRQLPSTDGLKVYEVMDVDTNRPYMIRLMDITRESQKGNNWYELYEDYQMNVTNYKYLPRVSTISMLDENQVYSLLDFQQGEWLTDRRVLEWNELEQLIEAIRHLHRKNIIHGSISAENIWITNEQRVILYGTGEGRALRDYQQVDNVSIDIEQLLTVIRQYTKINLDQLNFTPKKLDDVVKVLLQAGTLEQEPTKKKRVGLVEKKRAGLTEKIDGDFDIRKDSFEPDKKLKQEIKKENTQTVSFIESVTVGPLQFFESKGEGDFLSPHERVYKDEFPSSVPFINWALNISYPKTQSRQVLHFECIYYEPDGSIKSKRSIKRYANEGTTGMTCSETVNASETTKWKPGNYRVAILLGGKPIVQGGFIILKEEPTANFNVDSLEFFEGGFEPDEKGSRNYQTSFSQSSTRYVYWELNLSHPAASRRKQYTFDFVYFNQDGTVFGSDQFQSYIEKGWTSSYHSIGHGYSEAGNWQPGKYRVEIALEGKKIAEKTFEIMKTNDRVSSTISVDSFLLYETGEATISKENRVYQTEFSKMDTRYVGWEINLEHPPVPERKEIQFEIKYFSPDGKLFGEVQYLDSYLDQGWSNSGHTWSYGWADPGYWSKGKYRVEISLEGKKLAEKVFHIVDDHLDFIQNMKLDYMQFYESGFDLPDKNSRVYMSRFSQNETRYVAWEVNLSYPELKKRKSVLFEYIYYTPDGDLFAEGELRSHLEEGWDSSWHSMGSGFNEKGNWTPGKYWVEIKLQGKVIAKESFEIISGSQSGKKWYQFWA